MNLKKLTGSREFLLFIIVIAMFAIVSIINPAFFSFKAVTDMLRNNAVTLVMALGMLAPSDPDNPAAVKKQAVALSKEFQARFKEIFGALRCQELLPLRYEPGDATPAAKRLGLSAQQHCRIMIVTAAEIVDAMISERGLA